MTNTTAYWPGTNVPRSTGNAFDWRNTAGAVAAAMVQAQIRISAGERGAEAQQSNHFNVPIAPPKV